MTFPFHRLLPHAPKRQKFSGMALVLTLLILVLVTVFMTEFFFETTLEIRAIENFKSTFVAQSAVKSMFKAVFDALVTYDEEDLFDYLRDLAQLTGNSEISLLHPPQELVPLEGFFPDLEGVIVYTPYIRPIDHLFNLNGIQSKTGAREPTSDRNKALANEFINLVEFMTKTPPAEGSTALSPLPLEEIESIYEAIFDWIDKDEVNYAETSTEAEAYAAFPVETGVTVKNRKLDRLTEINLIAGVAESRIPYETWKKHFTIYDVGSDGRSKLNVNLANEEEIASFLKRFAQDTQYNREQGVDADGNLQEFAKNAEPIANALVVFDEETGQRVRYRDYGSLRDALLPLKLTKDSAKKFFILHSQWYEIRLVAEALGIQAEINAIVFVERNSSGKPTKTKIKDFLLR